MDLSEETAFVCKYIYYWIILGDLYTYIIVYSIETYYYHSRQQDTSDGINCPSKVPYYLAFQSLCRIFATSKPAVFPQLPTAYYIGITGKYW